jgi:hypothetical protein
MWGRKRILLEGTQAMPACPSDKDTMRVNKAHLNNIQEFSPYLRENSFHNYKAQLVNAVEENNFCLH